MTNKIKGGATIVVNDARMAPNPGTGKIKPEEVHGIFQDPKHSPDNMDKDVTTSVLMEKLKCPQCGKSTLHAEFPDQYETWTKCSSCGFFMGMSNEEWHRMQNSPNINEKLKRMANKKGLKGNS